MTSLSVAGDRSRSSAIIADFLTVVFEIEVAGRDRK
jgi:hypothetical protein